VATKFLTAEIHSIYVKEWESETFEMSELDILPPAPQSWLWPCYANTSLNNDIMCPMHRALLSPHWEANSQLCLSVKWTNNLTSFDLKNQHNATGRHNHNRKRVVTLITEVKKISVLCV